jgi:hypothetical protein
MVFVTSCKCLYLNVVSYLQGCDYTTQYKLKQIGTYYRFYYPIHHQNLIR